MTDKSAQHIASYERLEHRGVYHRQVAEREEEFVVNWLRQRNCQQVLEVGSGSGRFTRHLVQLAQRVVATDSDPQMLSHTQQRVGSTVYNISYHQCPVTALAALPGYGSFDAAVAMRVVPHCHHWREALRTIVSAVRPGGLALFDLWNRRSFVAWLLRQQQHDDLELVHRLEPAEIRNEVAELPVEPLDTLRWGYPRLGPLAAENLLGLLFPNWAYSTTFCVRVK